MVISPLPALSEGTRSVFLFLTEPLTVLSEQKVPNMDVLTIIFCKGNKVYSDTSSSPCKQISLERFVFLIPLFLFSLLQFATAPTPPTGRRPDPTFHGGALRSRKVKGETKETDLLLHLVTDLTGGPSSGTGVRPLLPRLWRRLLLDHRKKRGRAVKSAIGGAPTTWIYRGCPQSLRTHPHPAVGETYPGSRTTRA